MAEQLIYLDHAATTPVDPAVVAAMSEAMTNDRFGNPSSRHALGLEAERQVRAAREALARQLRVQPRQLTFTSGGTEALALALLGAAARRRAAGHVLVSALEHDAVRRTANLLQRSGHELQRVPACSGGWIEPKAVVDRLRDDTFLVAIMQVNNETGIEQPVAEIGRLVGMHGDCLLLVDAVQSFGKLAVEPSRLGAHLLAISGHKIHGPKGVGCLVRASDTKLAPLWEGGGQEDGLRAGTENVPGIIGLATAAALQASDDAGDRLRGFASRLRSAVVEAVPSAYAIGDDDRRVPQIIAFGLPRLRSEVVVNALSARGVLVSSGSACHSRKTLRSPVLEAMGIPRDHGVIRISLGRTTTLDEIERAAAILTTTLRELS